MRYRNTTVTLQVCLFSQSCPSFQNVCKKKLFCFSPSSLFFFSPQSVLFCSLLSWKGWVNHPEVVVFFVSFCFVFLKGGTWKFACSYRIVCLSPLLLFFLLLLLSLLLWFPRSVSRSPPTPPVSLSPAEGQRLATWRITRLLLFSVLCNSALISSRARIPEEPRWNWTNPNVLSEQNERIEREKQNGCELYNNAREWTFRLARLLGR